VADTLKKNWVLTQEAFDHLLALLDADRERAGRKYAELRQSLEKFFEWRGADFPEEYADETLNRVARKVAGGEAVRELPRYCFGVARLVLLEAAKRQGAARKGLAEFSRRRYENDDAGRLEAEVECLQKCLDGLPRESREIITEYYQGEVSSQIVNRKRLAERLKIPPGTLRMRALRLREALEGCVSECLKAKGEL
jgi:DNA-directed RNA polymerase specialized sigma24 family protein